MDEPPDRELKPTTADEFRRRAVCLKRYGRATVTIRRWGGWAELLGGTALSEALVAYEQEGADPHAVAVAFVRARVVGHSPTFRWEGADIGRLLKMVVSCSTEPEFDNAEPEHVAGELLLARDRQRGQAQELARQLTKSLQPTVDAANRLAAASQAAFRVSSSVRIAEALAKSMRMPAVGLAADWAASLPRIGPGPALLGAKGTPLPLAKLDFQQFVVPGISTWLESIQRIRPSLVIPTALLRSAAGQGLTLGGALAATQSAAVLARELGDEQSAEALEQASAEAESGISAMDSKKMFAAIEHLAQVMEANERQRREDRDEDFRRLRLERREDGDMTLVLWAIAMLVQIYLAVLPYMNKP